MQDAKDNAYASLDGIDSSVYRDKEKSQLDAIVAKATGTVLVKARSGRPGKITKRQRRRMVRMVKDNPQITSKELQGKKNK